MPAPAAWLALWNDVDPEVDDEYNSWHADEHVPQRLTVPGITAAARYRSSGADLVRYFTWYALEGPQVLQSEPYQRLLAQPTPWSRRMRLRLRNLARYVCVTRVATAGWPGQRLRAQLLGAAHAPLACRPPGGGGLLVGEVDRAAAPLPWAGAPSATDVSWVRLEDVGDPFPGTYLLLQQFRSN